MDLTVNSKITASAEKTSASAATSSVFKDQDKKMTIYTSKTLAIPEESGREEEEENP